MRSALRRHRKKLLLLAILFLVGVGPYLVSRARSPGRRVRIVALPDVAAAKSAGKVNSLRILTYNIAHGRGATDGNWEEGGEAKRERIAKIAALISREKPDIVVLNEVDFDATWSGRQNQAEAIARHAGFRYRVEQRNIDFRFVYGSWRFGNAVLSRYPIVAAEIVDYPPVAAWESWLAGNKRGVVCTLELSRGQRVRVVAVHLETRDVATRVKSAKRLLKLQRESPLPVILAGDFNATLRGFPHAEQPTEEPGDLDALELLAVSGGFRYRPMSAPQPLDFTFSSSFPDRVIDWVLIPRQWRFSEYRVLDCDLSDHRPVVATMRITK